jgi:FKBP-type peptidyl-prolyl cis-trans isomerase FkpA
MQKVSLLILAAAVILGSTSCKNAGFQRAKGGVWYKIIHGSNDTGSYAMAGTILKFEYTTRYKDQTKDTLLRTTIGSMPVYQPMDSQRLPAPFFGIFSKLKAGDSLVMKMLTDSIFKTGQPMPPMFKKGEYISHYFKVLAVFPTPDAAQADYKASMAKAQAQDSIQAVAQKVEDDKSIEAYLTKNNIKTIKAPKGTYVEILDPGTGAPIDSSKTVGVNYTGRTLGNTEAFDSNTDTAFHHKGDTLKVNMALTPQMGGMIIGFTDGISVLRQGAKARLYIPSSMGYGSHGREPKIKANENLVFDVDVLSVVATPASPKGSPMAMGQGGQRMSPEMMAKLRAMQQARMQQQGAAGAAAGQKPAGH